MNKNYLMLIVGIALVGCSTPKPKVGVENAGREVIVATLNDESEPSWVKKASERTFYVDDDQVISIGSTTLPGDSRTDAGFKIAEANARANIGKIITNRMESFTHIAEEGVDMSGIQLRSITAEATKLTASGMKPARRFYSKVAVTGDDGVPRTEYRFWAEITMSEEDYKKAIVQASKQIEKKNGLSQAFSTQVERHFEHFTETGSADQGVHDQRKPASAEAEKSGE